jgi:predicted O-methyltransferase YrrM
MMMRGVEMGSIEAWKRLALRSTHAVREQDPRRVAMFAIGRVLKAAGGKPLHYAQQPALLDFHAIGGVTMDPAIMAAALGCPETDFPGYLSEFEREMFKAQKASTLSSLRFPDVCRSELDTQRVLYSVIRAGRPRVVLETGVADGFSSLAILLALEANGEGHLHSLDIRDDVGTLVPTRLRSRWTLHVMNSRKLERSMKDTLATLPRVDFYYHDSGHSYLWQAFEYATVALKMAKGSIFVSDDVDSSYAFIDHCKTSDTKPILMIDRRKVIGGYVVLT